MVVTVVTAGKVDKVANVAAAVNLATEEKAATVVTAGKVEKVAKAVSAFRSYYIISLLRILRRERYVFAYNAREARADKK